MVSDQYLPVGQVSDPLLLVKNGQGQRQDKRAASGSLRAGRRQLLQAGLCQKPTVDQGLGSMHGVHLKCHSESQGAQVRSKPGVSRRSAGVVGLEEVSKDGEDFDRRQGPQWVRYGKGEAFPGACSGDDA